MATYSYQSTRRTWLRTDPTSGFQEIEASHIDPLIAAWARTWYDNGGWVLNDFRRNGEPAHLDVTLTNTDHAYKWSFEMKVNGLLIALFDVSRADKPRRGRIRVRSAPHSAPYYLNEDGEKS